MQRSVSRMMKAVTAVAPLLGGCAVQTRMSDGPVIVPDYHGTLQQCQSKGIEEALGGSGSIVTCDTGNGKPTVLTYDRIANLVSAKRSGLQP